MGSKRREILLLEDVVNLGKKGEITAAAKGGFVRNYLLPQGKVVFAGAGVKKIQKRLQEERLQQGIRDRKEAEEIVRRLAGKSVSVCAKNDSNGHLYGSVNQEDIVRVLFEEEGISVDKKSVLLDKPIKRVGSYEIRLSLNEGVKLSFTLCVDGEIAVDDAEQSDGGSA